MGYSHDPHASSDGRPHKYVRDFHGAAIIAEDGTEIPITESMVSGALESMHRQWCQVRRRQGATVD